MTDAWTNESNWMEELQALNHPNVSFEHVFNYLSARYEAPDQLFTEADFSTYTAAQNWYNRFTFKTPNPHPFPNMSSMVDSLNPLLTFKAKFDLWYQKFHVWLTANGYDVNNPDAAPDKRRKAADPAKLARVQEAERAKEHAETMRRRKVEAEQHYSKLTSEAQKRMMHIVEQRNSVLAGIKADIYEAEVAYRAAKAAI